MSATLPATALLCLSVYAGQLPTITTLSSRADKVSGGEALVRIRIPDGLAVNAVSVQRNGKDITAAFRPEPGGGTLLGLVSGLRIGQNLIQVFPSGERLALINFPSTGPIFSGPQEQPFACQTESFRLPNGRFLGAPVDANCSVRTVVTYMYKSRSGLKPLPAGARRPEDVVITTTTAGLQVPYIVRVETGTLNRSLYQTAVLHDPFAGKAPSPFAPPKAWNQRLLYSFGGGCTGGWYRQGAAMPSVIDDEVVGKGYAAATATLNVFGNNCQDVVAAETMMMVKERFIENYGPPAFTFGKGGSGGSYQQLQIADGYPGLLDGIIPSATFPDVLETTQFLVDAQLLDNYFRRYGVLFSEVQKRAVAGVGTMKNVTEIADGAGRINPVKFCPPELLPELRYDPVMNRGGARCNIFDHTVNVYGRDPSTGFARRAIDNIGVQYGLAALNAGTISTGQFLDLNERIGGYDNDGNPAPERATADLQAVRAAYQTGRVTHGGLGLARVPIIDVRSYTDLTDKGDVHQKYHSYSLRERLGAANGSSANAVMLVSAPRSAGIESFAIAKMDEWLTNLTRIPASERTVEIIARAKPADLSDACYSAVGDRILEVQTFAGGECNGLYPTFPPPRMIAGGPMANNILKCELKPVDSADYSVKFTEAERRQLKTVFPDGVCDWKKPGVEQQKPVGTWLQY